MSITRVGGSGLIVANATTTWAASYSFTAGNFGLVALGATDSMQAVKGLPTSVSDNLGTAWTVISNATTNAENQTALFAYRENLPAGVNAVTAAGFPAGFFITGAVSEYSGVAPSASLRASNDSTGPTPQTSPALSVTVGDLIVCVGVCDSGANAPWTNGGGWSFDFNAGDGTSYTPAAEVYEIAPSTASTSISLAYPPAGPNITTLIAAFKPGGVSFSLAVADGTYGVTGEAITATSVVPLGIQPKAGIYSVAGQQNLIPGLGRTFNIGFNRGPASLVASPGKYGIMAAMQSAARSGLTSFSLAAARGAYTETGKATSLVPVTTVAGGSLLSFMNGLTAAGGKVMAGQHLDYYEVHNAPAASLGNGVFNGGATVAGAYYQGTSARYQPAIIGIGLQGPYNGGFPISTQQYGTNGDDTATLANSAISNRQIPMLSCWMVNPASDITVSGGEGDFKVNPWPDIITQNGNPTITNWQTNLRNLAVLLNRINGSIILRLFVELNLSGSFWYALGAFGGTVTNAMFQTLWTQTRTYLQSQITNPNLTILWLYNINAGVGNYMGGYVANQVDLLGYDIYFDKPGTGMVSDGVYALFLATGKPFIICEMGSNGAGQVSDGTPLDQMIQDIVNNAPKTCGMVCWCGGDSPAQVNTPAQITTYMTDPNVITQAQVPSGVA